MDCKELLRRGHSALHECTRLAERGDGPALWPGLAELSDSIADIGARVPCISRPNDPEGCCDCQCTELREAYGAGLLGFRSVLPAVQSMLEAARQRLVREKTFLGVAQSWAECSQRFDDNFGTIATTADQRQAHQVKVAAADR